MVRKDDIVLAVDFCQNTVKGWQIAGYIITLIKIIAPIIIIITSMIPFLDALVKGDSTTLFGSLKILFKKLVAALIIFFVPSIVGGAIELLANRNYVTNDVLMCSSCFEKPNGEDCVKSINDINDSLKAEAEKFKQDSIKGSVETSELRDAQIETEESGEIEQNGDNGNGAANYTGNDNAVGSTSSNVKGTTNIIIGDSRTVGMCATFTGNWSGCNTGSPLTNGKDIYISKGSMGYTWFESVAVPNANSILSSNSSTTYNIFSLMGVNFLLSDINKYIPKYNQLASGDWSKHRIILVSVNPVNEAVEANNGYSTRNSDIESFNSQLKSGTSGKSNMTYCDVYNRIKGSFGSPDGLHYTGETYQQIYNAMMGCV